MNLGLKMTKYCLCWGFECDVVVVVVFLIKSKCMCMGATAFPSKEMQGSFLLRPLLYL